MCINMHLVQMLRIQSHLQPEQWKIVASQARVGHGVRGKIESYHFHSEGAELGHECWPPVGYERREVAQQKRNKMRGERFESRPVLR